MSLEKEDIDRLREIFVTKERCDSDMEAVRKVNADIRTELELIKDKISTITWVAKTTLGAVIGFIVVYVANLLFK